MGLDALLLFHLYEPIGRGPSDIIKKVFDQFKSCIFLRFILMHKTALLNNIEFISSPFKPFVDFQRMKLSISFYLTVSFQKLPNIYPHLFLTLGE